MPSNKDILDPIVIKADRVNWSASKPKRGGIVLCDNKGFYLGVDNNTKDLTDLGGEIHYICEDAILGSIREYEEEGLKCLPQLNWLKLFSSYVILGNSIVIFLIKIDVDLDNYMKEFRQIKKIRKHVEISDIVYVEKDKIKDVKIYEKIRPLIEYAAANFPWD